jgi:hypothetical protein
MAFLIPFCIIELDVLVKGMPVISKSVKFHRRRPKIILH